jgi:ubiquinone/menaquinone biosynthesis C-methylase UbiE
MMAKAYPNSTFTGFDFHKESIEKANESAKKKKINNVKFEVSSASEFPGSGYDFVTFFDCLHDMGDPGGALTHTGNVIKKDDDGGGGVGGDSSNSGTCMIVEPFVQNITVLCLYKEVPENLEDRFSEYHDLIIKRSAVIHQLTYSNYR